METKIIYRAPLGNPRRKWKQDNFIISTFRASEKNIENPRVAIQNAKELGFNLLEFASLPPLEDTLRCIIACEEIGIDGIFQNMDAFGGFQNTKGTTTLNKEAIDSFLKHTQKFRHISGYYVWDEPAEEEQFIAARAQVDYLETKDPTRLPFTVALPSYNKIHTWKNGKFPSYIARYAEIVDPICLSFDYYPFKQYRMPELFHQLDDSEIYLDLAVVSQEAKKRKMPFWFYFQSQDNPHGRFYTGYTPAQLRSQQYLALLYGAKALQNYNIFCGALNRDGTPGPLYFETQKLNRICTQWGRTLMALQSQFVFHSPEVLKDRKEMAQLHNSAAESRILADEDLPFRCSVGELADEEGNRYLIIQNRDYEQDHIFELKLKQQFRIYEVSKANGMQKILSNATDHLQLHMEAGDAIFLRAQDSKEEPFLIDYILQK